MISQTKEFRKAIDPFSQIRPHLTWKLHLVYVLNRIRSKLYALNRMNCCLTIYCISYINLFSCPFLIIVMLFGQLYHPKPLECLHSHFLQGISTCSSFVKLTLMELHQFHTAVQVFIHKLCPSYLRYWFINAEVYTQWIGCNKNHLFIPQVNTNIGKMDFFIVDQ